MAQPWRWPMADEEAHQLPRPPGWPQPLEGFYLLARSALWDGTWWKLTEIYLLACYWHIELEGPGALLDDSLDSPDSYDKWEMSLEILTTSGVLRTTDGYPQRAFKVVH